MKIYDEHASIFCMQEIKVVAAGILYHLWKQIDKDVAMKVVRKLSDVDPESIRTIDEALEKNKPK
jgi:hypothetical protein